MIFKCKNGKEIYYYYESAHPEEKGKCDFFVSDVTSILQTTNPEVSRLMYITGFSIPIAYPSDDNTDVKNEYCEMLKEFVEVFNNDFIMLRVGYDDTIPLSELEQNVIVDQCIAAQELGFVNINSLTHLEYSQTFIYKNAQSHKFIEAIHRYEILDWLKPDFIFDDVFKQMGLNKNI